MTGGEIPPSRLGLQPPPTMQLHAIDWLMAGSTVALGIALLAAPLALVPKVETLYALHGQLEAPGEVPGLSRWLTSPWLPALVAAVPAAIAIASTVTRMRPRRRRALLALALLATVATAAAFTRGLLAPLLVVANGAP